MPWFFEFQLNWKRETGFARVPSLGFPERCLVGVSQDMATVS